MALAIVLLLGACAAGAQEWSQVNGAARDVGVGERASLFLVRPPRRDVRAEVHRTAEQPVVALLERLVAG
jgi:hypothetical protein